MSIIKLKNREINLLLDELIQRIQPWISKKKVRKIWGVPRGGVPVAYLLANKIKADVVDSKFEANIIVDDIISTGSTFAQIKALFHAQGFSEQDLESVYFDALIPKPEEKNWYIFPWEGTLASSAIDIPIRILEFIGEDPKREGLVDTPKRVIKSWEHLFSGYKEDVSDVLTVFSNEMSEGKKYDQMVILKDIEFYSMCEHHILPFFGKVHIAYIPSDKVVGISKLARVVDIFSRRLQIQERLTDSIAEAIQQHLQPKGVAVYVEAQHLCMLARGVQKQNSIMVTSALKGHFKEDESRIEFLLLSRR